MMTKLTINDKKIILQQILNATTTIDKVVFFESNKALLGKKCKIFLFDEEQSNVDDSFGNKLFGKCGIIGLGDYTKTWILDSRFGIEPRQIAIGKTLDFDLNTLTYLNRLINGRKIQADIGEDNVKAYFDFIKKNNYQCGISTAIMERITTEMKYDIFAEMLLSFSRFDAMDNIYNIPDYISPDQYAWAKSLYDYSINAEKNHEEYRQYHLLCCAIMKAIILKQMKGLTKNQKVQKFVEYCLNDLQCYLEKEIVLLSMFILDDENVKETFKKLNRWKKIEENIYNVAWDLFHIRLMECMMLADNKGEGPYIFPYFATADNGLKDALAINPLKAFAIIDDEYIAIHQKNINDVPVSNEIKQRIGGNFVERRHTINNIDFEFEKNRLLKEIIQIKSQMVGMI